MNSSWILTICLVLDLFFFYFSTTHFYFSVLISFQANYFFEWYLGTLKLNSSDTSFYLSFYWLLWVMCPSVNQPLWSRWCKNLIDKAWVYQASESEANNWVSPTQNTWSLRHGDNFGEKIKVRFFGQHIFINISGLSLHLRSSNFISL